MTNGAVWHRHDNRSSLFKQHKGKLQEGIGTLIKMSSQSGYLVEQSELLFFFSEFRELWLGLSWLPRSPGLACSETAASSLLFRQTGLDILNSDPKQRGSTPPLSTLPALFVIGEVFVSLTLSLGVCLPDTCLAWPTFSLISSVNVRTCEGHLPILLCESLPARCLCQQLGTDSHPRSLQSFAPGPTGQRQHISPNRQPHLHAHKSLTKLTPSHTTRHDTQPRHSECQIAVLRDIRL